MSYDFFLMKLERPISDSKELTIENMLRLGNEAEIMQQISSVVPDITWERRFVLWTGRVRRPNGVSIEFQLDEETGRSVVARSGLGRPNLELLEHLCASLGWTMQDAQKDTLSGANVLQ